MLSLLLQLVVPGGVLHSGRLSKIRRGGNCCDHKKVVQRKSKTCLPVETNLFFFKKSVYFKIHYILQ